MATTQGRFCWYDLMSRDPARAREFYTRLLGWTVKDVDMGPMGTYAILHNQDVGVGGIMPFDAPGMPSHWMPYITVLDIDASAAKVGELGGKVCVPVHPIPNVGRFCVIEDRQGAYISLIQLDQEDETRRHDPGFFVWNELQTTDPEDASRFYADLLGWSFKNWDMGPGGVYFLILRAEQDLGGIMKTQGEYPPLWLSYVHVTDVDAKTAEAKELGANALVPPTDIPNIGRFSIIQDPTGAALALYTSKARQG